MDVRKKMLMLRMTAMAVVIFFMAFNVSRLDNAFNYVDENNKRVIDTMNEGLSTIPDDASVTATTFLCASLSKHKILYELYYTDKQTEYIALDLRYSDTYYNVSSYLNSSQYETVYYAEYNGHGEGFKPEKRAAYVHQLDEAQAARYTLENVMKS